MKITANHTLKKSLSIASKYFIDELFQNPRDAATPTQCNRQGEGSVCRCCCFSDECGKLENCLGKLYCLVWSVLKMFSLKNCITNKKVKRINGDNNHKEIIIDFCICLHFNDTFVLQIYLQPKS